LRRGPCRDASRCGSGRARRVWQRLVFAVCFDGTGEEEALIWVVGAESNHEVPAGVHHERVSTHGYRGEVGVVVGLVVTCVIGAAQDGLEDVAVEVKGMAAGIVVVDDYFDNLVLLEDEWVRVFAVDGGIVGVCAT
jgi:hypothetical protein